MAEGSRSMGWDHVQCRPRDLRVHLAVERSGNRQDLAVGLAKLAPAVIDVYSHIRVYICLLALVAALNVPTALADPTQLANPHDCDRDRRRSRNGDRHCRWGNKNCSGLNIQDFSPWAKDEHCRYPPYGTAFGSRHCRPSLVVILFLAESNNIQFLVFETVVAEGIRNARLGSRGVVSSFAEYAAGCHDGVDCGAGNCPNVTSANTTTIAESNSTSLYNQGVSGFVTLDHTNELIVLQFGGTNTCPKVDVDVDYDFVNLTKFGAASCSGCQIHQRFWRTWTNTKNVTLPPVERAMAQYSAYEIVFVGHSLGVALAAVEAAEFRTHGPNVTVYSYASPSVENFELSEFISNQTNGVTYRLTHSDDIVPRILHDAALLSFIPDYSQLSPEYWITIPSYVTPNASSIQELEGINNTEGNLQYRLRDRPELAAHLWYIQNMTICPDPSLNLTACCNGTWRTPELCQLIGDRDLSMGQGDALVNGMDIITVGCVGFHSQPAKE
ncbi:alpha/beta-hydrolase [Aspergillus indologenus CBS 114.80]|uniref:feruloyl esterase n=1 Tax=Aspergillus indologenus CBS 114.80 TaxID=1450541 RepID=A0A2V5HT62_9EURO|nr:alpha/beta-hydrolase [Aspergillus indologenus CBS 114.80]